ncbi:unnamed protein product [Caenorhabditis auriculariae]|uniref:Midasin n=1 Tax=Caenorhabditis auriculariae TaxID=2777116 RepID=A0A8S1HIW9_9PELO|nr:unnamed protein product [Caenorhabditis auriculariae]
MRDGFPLLVDEISLAEDSVLERLNPLFEEDRTLLLSDAGVETQIVHSSEGFQLVATMNPGGDYGKKELSKALRNRFTEVWTASDYSGDELLSIFDARLTKNEATRDEARVTPTQASKVVVAWIAEFFEKYSHVFRHAPSVRDVVACAELYSSAVAADVSRPFAVRDALSAVFLDSLSGLTTRLAIDADVVLQDALKMLSSHLHKVSIVENAEKFLAEATATTSNALIHQTADYLQIGHLKVEYGKKEPTIPRGFSLKAPTCVENFYRIASRFYWKEPPDVEKSSTVMALAQLTGNAITRLNLSDQTDLSDLFGSDVPVISDSGNITFRWEDGPVLRAIKNGEWVLLDEMNLASQSVLEGLNACFDHRRILYIAELNRSFEIPSTSNCRFFACQNPRVQGGNRRALPKSFVNRFTNIYTNDLTSGDVEMILEGIDVGRKLSGEERRRMVAVNEECARLAEIGAFVGGPHSFNLRDLLRWFELTASTSDFTVGFEIVYVSRMRREEDRDQLHSVFEKLMMMKAIYPPVQLQLDQNFLRIGKADIVRKPLKSDQNLANSRLLPSQMKVFHELATCVQMNWLALIVGQRNGGKRTIVENLATLSGRTLQTISLNADTDAQELIGSYEQIVDENVVGEAKKQLYQLLEPKISDESTLKKILASGELLDLETATEMALAQCEDQKTVTSCREVLSDASGSAMRFEWIDSVFVRAYLSGHWLLIEDVNLCSAAVLDRLNSCLESGGKLVVAERQNSYEPLSPHPDFRVFLSLDSRAGEISRAMRNRSVEIFMDETSRWHTSVDDVASVVSREELTMSQEIATNVSRLSTEDQLHLAVLLREMPLEIACRYIGVEESMEDEDEEELLRPVCSTTKAVLVREIAALGLAYDTWLANNWRKAAADQIGVEYLLLPFLSSTSSGVANRVLEKVFGRVSESFYTRVLPLLPSPSHRLIDSTFNAGRKSWNKEKETEKFTNNVVFEWALQLAQKIEVLHGSAEHLCRTMTKYEMATSELGFANLPHIAPIIDAILKTLKDGSIKGDRESIFLLALTFLLMTSAARRQLTPRAGCAPLYLVWNDVQKALSSQNIALPSQLAIIAEKLDKGWSSEAHDSFSKDYLVRWRRNALVKPFDNKNQCERYSNQLEEAISAAAAQNSEETEDVHMNEENEEEQKVVIPKSPVDESLRLAASVQALHAFFSAGVVDFSNPVFVKLRPFDGLNWSDPSAARWLQMAAAMSTTLRTSSEDSDVCVLPSSTGGAHSLISHSFFTALSFDPTLQLLAVAHLQNLTMKELRTRLWRFSLNSTPFSDSLGNALLKLQNGLAGWNEPKEAVSCWTERINSGLEMMRKALPPMDTLDPVVFEEERLLFVQKKREIVENQLQLLASYRKLVSRQSPECDSMSSHPIIRRLNQLRQELVAAEKDHNEEVEQNKEAVYRQSANQYSALCAEMRSFFDVALTTSSEASKERTEEDDQMASLAIRTAQLTSFLMSAQSFRQTLLRKYTSFVDVTSPFIAGVMLIECALRESSRKLAGEQRGLELATVAFPKFLKVQPTVDGPLSPEVTAWALRDASPMPLRLKATLVTRRLTDDVTPRDSAVISGEPIFDLQWTRLQWKKWYERNVAKAAEKDFVYRSKTEEEKDELDVVEFFSNENQEKEILPASDVSLMLEAVEDVGKGSLVEESEQKASVLRYRMALAWIRHVIGGVDKMPNDDVTALLNIDSDQTLLELISKREGLCDDGGKEEIIDVYRNSSLRECRRAAEILEKLAVRTREVQERWSEVVALKNVLRAIEEFSATPISTPHIKLAGQIEKLIEECDHWEQMADRANSLQEPLRALQGLLVDWKKMEVRCWSSLLQRTEADAKQRTQLVAFPLFEALYNAETPESLASIVPMAVEWMHNASIVDFSTRVTTVTSLAKWAELLEKAELASRIRSAASHFRQFIPVVEEKLKDERDFAEMNLKDYLKIVKYKDLNLWSIKVSSHKAHIQLFKIIRKFKDAVNPQIDSDFDNLLKMNEWIKLAKPDVNFTSSESSDDVPEDVAEMNKRLKRASKLAGKISENAASLCDDVSLVELTEQVKSADNSIRTMINYVGEDEEKEKQQGYARNSRQREVAMVLKESQAIGWNARRAVALKAEALNELSVSGVPQGVWRDFSAPSSSLDDPLIFKRYSRVSLTSPNLVRNCSSGRNTTIRKANKVNDQVGISTRKHLTGMIEYGISWQMSLHQKISKYRAEIDKISSSSKALNTAVANFKEEWHIDHESLASDISKVDENLRNISIFVSAMKRRVESIPDNVNDIDASCSDHLHPLSKLGSNDETAKKVRQLVGHLVNLSDTMTLTNGNCGDRKIYEKKDVTIWTNQHLSDSKEMRSVASELAPWFAVETAQILEILNSLETIVTKQRNIEPQIKTVEPTSLLMIVQSLYKDLVELRKDEKPKTEDEKKLDVINVVAMSLENCDIRRVITWLESLVEELRIGICLETSSLAVLASLVDVVRKLLTQCNALLADTLAQFCQLYHAVLSLTVQLFEKGYVNTIPKAEKQESGEGQTDEAGEGGGMGEGSTANDAKDVTDEMEETGQLEGLQDEPPADVDNDRADNTNEKPIEMEDDFAEDLQDIDKNDKGGPDDEEGDDEEEPEPEDQMGDVEEEDEKQLDPKLWDDEDEEEQQQDQQKNMDQENTAADQKTDDMVAKEDEPQPQEDGEQKPEDVQEDQENVDERDREDDDGGDVDDKNQQPEVDEEARREDEIGPDDDETKGDDSNMDEMMEDDGDETDKEDDENEETKDGEGDEENEESADVEMDEPPTSAEEDKAKNEESEEKMEQGTGGERNDEQKNDQETGGANEDDEEEEDEQKKEEQGEGKSKNDPRGESGAGEDAKEKEDKEDEEEDEMAEENREKAERRELADENRDLEEEAEQGEGEENESGKHVENAPAAERQMLGAGSLDEAKQTKREEQQERKAEKKRKLPQGLMDQLGAEESGEVEDDEAEDVQQASIHLAAPDMFALAEEVTRELVIGNVAQEEEPENPSGEKNQIPTENENAESQWAAMSRTVSMLSAELAENLRLILEPQRASKMQGDYRSGKRLNMRRLIPYIASEYRKDRIWMRRTKRAQREYQILIAVDDSASMNENGIHQVTCESVCVVEDALRRCDAGSVSVCSFGSEIRTIVPFGESSATSSVEMLKKLSFGQKSTDLLLMLKTARRQLDEIRTPTSEQMLIVVSDGRGALAQGADKVKAHYAALQGVTVLFVILDSGDKSIHDLKVASFKDGGVVLTPYLSLFPFPFYAIVNTIQQLPSVIAESIRQWFEMTAQTA